MENELYHYGVLGMKWGVRRYQNKDGTLTAEGKAKYGDDVSLRKPKHVKKQVQAGLLSRSIDTSKINAKVVNEADKTKEGKAVKNVNDFLESIFKDAESQGISRRQIVFGKDTADWVNNTNAAYEKKVKEIATKYVDEYTSVTLTSLGYKDTAAAREWLKQQNFMDW